MGKENIKLNRGGKRKGAGRNPAPYKTTTIAFRVRVEWIDEIKRMVKKKVEQLKEQHNDK
jgi:hypothetical protein